MCPSSLLSKLKYFSKPELMSIMKAFSSISPGNASAVVTAVEGIEQEVRATRASYLLMEPHTATAIENLEKFMGHKFRYPAKAAALLPRLSSPVHYGNVTFFHPRSPPPLPDCLATMGGYSGMKLIRMFEDFSVEHESDIMTLVRDLEEQMEAKRARIVVDPDIRSRIEKVENAIGHRFRDPRRAAEALTHPSYLHRSSREMSRFPLLQFVGEGFIKSVAEMHLHGPRFLDEGKEFNFPIEVADTIAEVATSREFLARVAVRLGLWENSLHCLPAAVREKVKMFEASVEKGAFNVRPPKVLRELTGTIGASIYHDCLSIEVFYLKWVDNLFLQDNPVFVTYDRCRTDNPILCRRYNPEYFPSLTRKSGVWVVKHNDKILGSGKGPVRPSWRPLMRPTGRSIEVYANSMLASWQENILQAMVPRVKNMVFILGDKENGLPISAMLMTYFCLILGTNLS